MASRKESKVSTPETTCIFVSTRCILREIKRSKIFINRSRWFIENFHFSPACSPHPLNKCSMSLFVFSSLRSSISRSYQFHPFTNEQFYTPPFERTKFPVAESILSRYSREYIFGIDNNRSEIELHRWDIFSRRAKGESEVTKFFDIGRNIIDTSPLPPHAVIQTVVTADFHKSDLITLSRRNKYINM